MKKTVSLILIFSVFLTTLTGCAGSSGASPLLKEFSSSSYTSKEVFNYNVDDVYKAAVDVLHDKGYQITISDSYAGILTAEYNTESLIPEEIAAMEKNQTQSACVTILGIVLIFGLIAVIISAIANNSGSSSSSSGTCDNNTYYSDAPVKSSRYQLTFTFTVLEKNVTEVGLNVIKSEVENGTIVKQQILENKYLNNGIFKKMDQILKGDYRIPAPDTLLNKY